MVSPDISARKIAGESNKRGSGAAATEANHAAQSSLDARLAGLSARSQRVLREVRNAIDARQLQRADKALDRLRDTAGDHPEYLRLLGVTRHLQKRHEDALAVLRRADDLAPKDALILVNLGSALRGAGVNIAAEAALVRACKLAPDFAAAWYNLGRARAADSRPDEAHAAYARALECDPGYLNARIGFADTLRTRGQIEQAATEYRRAIAQAPEHMRAWGRLVNLKTVALYADEITKLEHLQAGRSLGPEDRVTAGFALGHALERAQRYAEAFSVFSAANAEKRRRLQWNATSFSRGIDATMQAFDQPPKTAADPDAGSEVIFIVSMPRSGSTLAEQMLASHPDVEGANELPDLSHVLDEESRRQGMDFASWSQRASPGDWRRLGQQYLERTARWRRQRSRFTDKALSNWSLIGAIAAMLPGARIVNCRRDPVETCVSCYYQLFSRGQAFSYDIPELAAYWRDYDRLMRFWNARYPHRVHDHSLEDVIADPETEVRRLLEFCGLPFDAACLRHQETPRNVRTISAAQVRESLRPARVRGEDYGPLLLPLRLVLGGETMVGGLAAA